MDKLTWRLQVGDTARDVEAESAWHVLLSLPGHRWAIGLHESTADRLTAESDGQKVTIERVPSH